MKKMHKEGSKKQAHSGVRKLTKLMTINKEYSELMGKRKERSRELMKKL